MSEVTLVELLALDEMMEARRQELGPGDFDGKGRLNAWECEECGAYIVSRDRDAGVTPYILRCKDETVGEGLGCGAEMTSKFYRLARRDDWPVSHEWIRPKTKEKLADALERDDEYKNYSDYLRRGGLHLARIIEEDGTPAETGSQRENRRRLKLIRRLNQEHG